MNLEEKLIKNIKEQMLQCMNIQKSIKQPLSNQSDYTLWYMNANTFETLQTVANRTLGKRITDKICKELGVRNQYF